MRSKQSWGCPRQHLAQRWIRLSALLAALQVVAGCTQMNQLKSRVDAQLHGHPAAMVTPAAAPAAGAPAEDASFAAIVNDQLQRGHYAEGEKALHRYLQLHPGDRPAQAMLRQLTAEPEQMLGRASRPYQVQAGDSYSSLAASYLGDPSLFVILARYNGSSNPSVLQVGQTVRLPTAASGTPLSGAMIGSAPAAEPSGGASITKEVPPATESSARKVARLQRESLALLAQGQQPQALARIDEALAIDPGLKPAGAGSAALRQQLLTACHQRAIVLYRDQQLDPAIALWDRVLAIDPHYEPAMAYRARALELKQRLKQF